MRNPLVAMTALSAVLLVSAGTTLVVPTTASADEDSIAAGKKLAYNRKKGNCLGCHVMDDGKLAGNIGPPLVAMKARFPDRAVLRAQIWDATKRNPNTMMPPFGRHKILSESEIDKIVDYVHTL